MHTTEGSQEGWAGHSKSGSLAVKRGCWEMLLESRREGAALGQRASSRGCCGQRPWHMQALECLGFGGVLWQWHIPPLVWSCGVPRRPHCADVGLQWSVQRCFICCKMGAAITCRMSRWGGSFQLPGECVRQPMGQDRKQLPALVVGTLCWHSLLVSAVVTQVRNMPARTATQQ